MWRFAIALFGLFLLALPAHASGKRVIDDVEARSWQAVGRLNIAGNRFCTATLITERIALTAAHCLFHPKTKKALSASEMTFVAGLRNGGHAAARRVARTALPAGYAYSEARSPRSMSADIALIELAAPIAAHDVRAFDVGAERRGENWSLVSYGKDRAHAPSIEDACGIVVASGALRALDCEVTFGASGSPVIAERNGTRRVVGVISASARRDNGPVAIAVMIAPHIDTLLADLGASRR